MANRSRRRKLRKKKRSAVTGAKNSHATNWPHDFILAYPASHFSQPPAEWNKPEGIRDELIAAGLRIVPMLLIILGLLSGLNFPPEWLCMVFPNTCPLLAPYLPIQTLPPEACDAGSLPIDTLQPTPPYGNTPSPTHTPSPISSLTPTPTITPTTQPPPTLNCHALDQPIEQDRKYVVEYGDNLICIAARAGLNLDELLAANPEYKENPKLIHPGDIVKVPRKRLKRPVR